MSAEATAPKRPVTIAFFNNKGGVGKTTLVYHLSWMMSALGYKVLAVDLDPQANLTSAFLAEDYMQHVWLRKDGTLLGALQPLIDHLGDMQRAMVWGVGYVDEGPLIGLLAGDLGLSAFEDRLAEAWSACLDENRAKRHDAFRVVTAFYRLIVDAATANQADVALIDVGPNLGALNRAALVAADYVVIPMGADLFSLRGLANLGPVLRTWREGWRRRLEQDHPDLPMPAGTMTPIGYVLQPAGREHSPTQAFQYWISKFPEEYSRSVLGQSQVGNSEEYLLGTLKNYMSLVPLSQKARKPVFALRAADGALGSHAVAAKASFAEFEALARRIATACGLPAPT